ncbi:MAG: homoserine dehydrogenase [Oscillospiraceae bacterium]|jgi:homoserine dehydrogenase|nr:homoserine dehydrogenase [Oscillospiraceae bacterium]
MKLAIMGYGVVGSGVTELLRKNYDSIVTHAMQESLELQYILDLRDFPGDPNAHLFTKDFQAILQDPAVGIVVETIGGLHPAFEFVRACLQTGKSVVTSNKELVAAKGYELLETAKAHNANFLFEASVGGGIPIIRPLSQCLAANEITEIAGILNGTTNFILTRMFEDDMPFAEALRLAQKNGYAEKDPTADIEGHDACRKICILAALAFGRHVYPEQVRTEGISRLQAEDVACAAAGGYAIKLLGRAARLADGRISATVAPALVPQGHLLANVRDVYNAVLVRGDAIEDVIFYGRGAGKLPTASAVVADIIDCGKHMQRRKFLGWQAADPAFTAPAEEDAVRLFVRGKCVGEACAVHNALVPRFPGLRRLERADAPVGELACLLPALPEGETARELRGIPDFTPETILRVAAL